MTTVLRHMRRVGLRLGFQRDWYLYLVAAAIGLLMGLVAVAFIWPLRQVEEGDAWLTSSTVWLLVLLGPAVGGLAVGLARKGIGATFIGPGVTTMIYGVLRQRGRLRLRMAVQKWICATLTIGSGGSAGAEGPIVSIGGVLGSNIGRSLGSNPQNTMTLLGCGAAAGIAAVFNAPIAGVLFVMEILLRDFSLRTFTPIVIAAAVASASVQGILHDEAIFELSSTFAIHEGEFRFAFFPAYIVLGLLCGLVAVAFIRAMQTTSKAFDGLPVPIWLKPAVGGALLAILGLCSLLWFGLEFPVFYGNGYPEITRLLDPMHYTLLDQQVESELMVVLLVLLGLKFLATCLTLGSGGAGGMFAPSLMMGALVGGLMGLGLEWVGLLEHGTPARFALVGMAAMVAATTHAPLTGILIVYELTRSYQVILPLMLASVVATILARALCRDSVYSAKLREAGIRLGEIGDLTTLRRLTVQDLILEPPHLIRADDTVSTLLEKAEDEGAGDYIVVGDDGNYDGMVTQEDLKATLVHREAVPLLQVSELRRTDIPTVNPEETLDVVLEKFAQADVDALAVLVDDDPARIAGTVTRGRLMKRYQSALDRDV